MWFHEFASRLRKSGHRKNAVFFQNGPPHFQTVFSTTCGTLKKYLSGSAHFGILVKLKWGPGPCEDQGAHFGQAGVLSVPVVLFVFVVLSVSVEGAMERRMSVY